MLTNGPISYRHLTELLLGEKVVGSERLEEEDQGSQISRFLEGYREGRTITKKISGPSLLGFIHSLININTVYIIVFAVALFMLIQHLTSKSADDSPQTGRARVEPESSYKPIPERASQGEGYSPGDKED